MHTHNKDMILHAQYNEMSTASVIRHAIEILGYNYSTYMERVNYMAYVDLCVRHDLNLASSMKKT